MTRISRYSRGASRHEEREDTLCAFLSLLSTIKKSKKLEWHVSRRTDTIYCVTEQDGFILEMKYWLPGNHPLYVEPISYPGHYSGEHLETIIITVTDLQYRYGRTKLVDEWLETDSELFPEVQALFMSIFNTHECVFRQNSGRLEYAVSMQMVADLLK